MFIGNENDWQRLFEGRTVSLFPATEKVGAEFVSKQGCDVDYDEWPRQGETEEVFVIFKVEDRYFKKIGNQDSYGEVTWSGTVTEVRKTTKTVEVYE